MTYQKAKIGKFILLAVFLPFLLFGLSGALFPDASVHDQPPPMPISKPETLLDQTLWTVGLLGLATLAALGCVGVVLFLKRAMVNVKQKNV